MVSLSFSLPLSFSLDRDGLRERPDAPSWSKPKCRLRNSS